MCFLVYSGFYFFQFHHKKSLLTVMYKESDLPFNHYNGVAVIAVTNEEGNRRMVKTEIANGLKSRGINPGISYVINSILAKKTRKVSSLTAQV